MTIKAPCGKSCDECQLFGTRCEGCIREMSFSFSYQCKEFDRATGESTSGLPCKVVDGTTTLCPLLVQKCLKPGVRLGSSVDTPVE